MQSRILTSIDRSLAWRARANAASAVRSNAQHAAQRQEASQALTSRLDRAQGAGALTPRP